MTKRKNRKAVKMDMEEVNENFREGQDDEAKINIVIGMPRINAISPQIVDHAASPAQQQDQVPLDPPQQSAPQPEVLHNGRISLRRGIEQKFIEDSVNNSLTPNKARTVKDKDVYTRLYSDHENKIIKEKQLKLMETSSPQPKRVSSAASPKPVRLFVEAMKKDEKLKQVIKDHYQQMIDASKPQINEVSRHIAERAGPTADRRAFAGDHAIIPAKRRDLTLEERTAIEKEQNGLTFKPQLTTLDPAIFASPARSGAAGAAGAGAISTPPGKQAAGKAAGSPDGEKLGVNEGLDDLPAHERLIKKGEKLKQKKEELRKKKEAEESSESHTPQLDPRSAKLASKNYNFNESIHKWVLAKQEISGASTDRVRGASADDAVRGDDTRSSDEAKGGSQTPRGRGRFFGESRNKWGERGGWISTMGISESCDEKKASPKLGPFPQVAPPAEDAEEWVENTYGVKKFLQRTELARRWKEEKPLFNPNRRYPREPTKICGFNLSKSKRELELQQEDEAFEA